MIRERIRGKLLSRSSLPSNPHPNPVGRNGLPGSTLWFLYVLRCSDGSLYTGITTCVERRVHEHNHTKKGAKYTRPRRPVTIEREWEYLDRSQASRAEAKFKKLSRAKKEEWLGQRDSNLQPPD